MNKKNIKFFFIIMLLLIPISVNADIGPKPSVVVEFEGLDNETYYVTLLSNVASTGPHKSVGKLKTNLRYNETDEDYDIWKKFLTYSYDDKDNYYFLQYFENCTENHKFTWGYYPPTKFKILIYFPEYDSFAVSAEIYERYAFDSYFKVKVNNLDIKSVGIINTIEANKNYNYSLEIITLVLRIIATIFIEILIALLFGFRNKKQLYVIAIVNIITQSVLNILLNIINYHYGELLFVFNYVLMELLVLVIETILYFIFINKDNDEHKGKLLIFMYALTANVVSFVLGFIIAIFLPGIF